MDDDARAWRLDHLDDPSHLGNLTPEPGAIRVFVEPPLPFAKEPGVVFRFDDAACWSPGRAGPNGPWIVGE